MFQQVKNVINNHNSIFYTHQIKDRYQIRAAYYKFKELLFTVTTQSCKYFWSRGMIFDEQNLYQTNNLPLILF